VLDTDLGQTSTDYQENQSSGTNILTYNVWGFDTSAPPVVRDFGYNNQFANVQQSNAKGYLMFFTAYIYNPTSSSGSADITVYLYDHLPENGPSSTPLGKFTFNSGTIDANSGAWITIEPNVYWKYNTLVMIPQQQTGTSGSAIGIANPNVYNKINSHYWTGSYWTPGDDGFIGYWSITNTAPASVPVNVNNLIETNTNISGQDNYFLTNPTMDGGAAINQETNYVYNGSYIGIEIEVPAYSYVHFQQVIGMWSYMASSNEFSLILIDDINNGNLDAGNYYGNILSHISNYLNETQTGQAVDWEDTQTIFSKLFSIISVPSSDDYNQISDASGTFVVEYNRKILTGSSSYTMHVYQEIERSANSGGGNDEAISLIYETNNSSGLSITNVNYDADSGSSSTSSGSSGGSGGGGGGCLSSDSIVETDKGEMPFYKIKIGTKIRTPNGFSAIKKIIYNPYQYVYEIRPDLWISDTQPFTEDATKPLRMLTEEEKSRLPKKKRRTYDFDLETKEKLYMVKDIILKDMKEV
jgi:hypothetical protein